MRATHTLVSRLLVAAACGNIGGGTETGSADTATAHLEDSEPRVTTTVLDPVPRLFVDGTERSGLVEERLGSAALPTRMVGGASVDDFDGDGLDDLLVIGIPGANRLYRNAGGLEFVDVTTELGLDVLNSAEASTAGGAVFFDIDIDIDGDADLDLFVPSVGAGPARLFVQDDGAFQDEAERRGVSMIESAEGTEEEDSLVFGASVTDIDHDGDLDLFTSQWHPEGAIDPGIATRTRMFVIDGRGVFSDGSDEWGLDGLTMAAFTATFADINSDGWQDLLLAGDFGTSRLLLNESGVRFRDVTAEANVGTDENGMGSAVADLNGDGTLDWFVSSLRFDEQVCVQRPTPYLGCSGNRLFTNDGQGGFDDSTDAVGVRNNWWGWGAAAFDYDNDGHLDLAVANGFFERAVDEVGEWDLDSESIGPADLESFGSLDRPIRLWKGPDSGRWSDVAAAVGLGAPGSSRAIVAADFDRDLDVAETFGGVHLFENTGPQGGSFGLTVVGPSNNRRAVGAVATATDSSGRTHVRTIRAGDAYMGQRSAFLVFGIGEAEEVTMLRVGFPPDDNSAVWETVEAGSISAGQTVTVGRHSRK